MPHPIPDENTPRPVPDENTPRPVPDENTPRPVPDENMPRPLSGVSDGEKAEDHMNEGTEKMVSDQDHCFSMHCDVNAECFLDGGSSACRCLHGFTGDGRLCLDIDECKLGTHQCDERADCINTMGAFQCICQAGYIGNGHSCQELASTSTLVTTSRPWDVTTQWVNSIESCPSSHDTYCLYEGVCFYLPEMESYACNCISGYMGERCQYSDLEWWDLQQTEQQKRRNTVIAVCMVVLVTLLSIAAYITYNYGSQRLFQQHTSVEDMSETSSSDATMSETTVPNTPRLYVVLEPCADGKNIHVIGCPRRDVCPSCSSETGESFLSEEARTLPRHNRGYECSSRLATMDTNQSGLSHIKPIDNLILLDELQP
ncbi:hypothetical protein UPYG_G00218670 [Umbra pygmaea]|uniref:EGF-like domain-containing protein n=1 Tax=Umbra pygmaea TaxID=75934 RepID=A0ABD0WRF5_UMBPY